MMAGQAFYNTSEFTLARLPASGHGQRLRDNFIDYLDGSSPNVQEILNKFAFRDQIQKMVDADILGHLITDFLNPDVNLSPLPVLDTSDGKGRIKLPALDNHGMGTVFEELIRRFNEENNEEAGEHFTPRDVVQLMADHIELFKQFSDNPNFKRWLTDTVFDVIYRPGQAISPGRLAGLKVRALGIVRSKFGEASVWSNAVEALFARLNTGGRLITYRDDETALKD